MIVPVQGYRCTSAWKRHSGWGALGAAQLSPSTHPSGTSSVRASPKSVLPLPGSQTWSELHSRPPCAPELPFFLPKLSPQSVGMQPGPGKNSMQEGTEGKQNKKTEYQNLKDTFFYSGRLWSWQVNVWKIQITLFYFFSILQSIYFYILLGFSCSRFPLKAGLKHYLIFLFTALWPNRYRPWQQL